MRCVSNRSYIRLFFYNLFVASEVQRSSEALAAHLIVWIVGAESLDLDLVWIGVFIELNLLFL